MLTSKYFTKKSKKGFTLVEAICAVFVLAIVFVGILNAVAFSRQMVFTNNAREKASFRGQLVADEILSTATGYDPDDDTKDPKVAIGEILDNASDPQNADSDTAIGKVANVDELSDPSSFTPTDDCYIQYTIKAVGEEDTEESDGTVDYHTIKEKGWDITVRVFYKEISGDSDYRSVDISAFAPFNYISNND